MIKVNKKLIWDYDFSEDEYSTEEFKCWYIARVLMRGGIYDVRNLGIDTIREYLPKLHLPERIRKFWEWYFSETEHI